jgi:hypothetical protein
MRRVGIFKVLLFALLLSIARASGAAGEAGEYQVKTAFLYNFALFTQEADTKAGDERPYRFCTFGKNAFGAALESLRGKKIEARVLELRVVQFAEDLAGCQMILFGRIDRDAGRRALALLAGKPVILVADGEHELASELVFQLVLVDDRVSFNVNLDVARARKLNVSSRLARLAVNQR